MPVFTFSGKNASGETIKGSREAPSKESLASALRKDRIVPSNIREKGKEFSLPTFGGGKVTAKEAAVFFRQFSVMPVFPWCNASRFSERIRRMHISKKR